MRNLDNDFTLPPFPAFPCVTRYVGVGSMQETMDRLSRAIDAREALSLVVGPPGTGKSLLCALLAQQFGETHDVVLLGDTVPADVQSFERSVLTRMGMPPSDITGDLSGLIEERVNGDKAKPCGLLLIVDEAQSLSLDILESIRMMTNIMYQGQPRVSAVLVGGVKLDETLTAPSLTPVTQRIATRCYLHPLNAGETRQYIFGAIQDCGAEPNDTINDEAIAAIHHATSGVPRLINQMMTEAIDCAAEKNQVMIDAGIIDRAWAQLQQLPSPMVEEPRIAGESSTVEFGSLDPMDSMPMDSMPHQSSVDVQEQLDAESVNPEPVNPEPVNPEPLDPEPVHAEHAHGEPMASVPMASVPMASVPMASVPMASVPMASVPMASVPMESDPMAKEPVAETPLSVETAHGQLTENQPTVDMAPQGESIADLALALATFDCVSQIIDSNDDSAPMNTGDLPQTECGQPSNQTTETETPDVASSPVAQWNNAEAAPLPAEMFSDVDFGTGQQESATVATDEKLFGDFDQEESLEIGTVSSAPAAVVESKPDDTTDLAEMVHSEIVSLSHFAADTIQIQTEMANEAETPEPEEEILDPVQGTREEPTVVWYDEPEPESPRYEDDSDIVMISEELPVESPRRPIRVDSRETTLNVDYKAILAKMRNAKA